MLQERNEIESPYLTMTESRPDYTMFFCILIFTIIFGSLFSLIFLFSTEDYHSFEIKFTKAATIVIFFVLLPLQLLSWSVIRFIINDGKIAVIDWFGVRKRKYTLDPKQKLSISNEDPQYKFRFLRSDSKYNKIKVLRFQTEEGKKIKIQTRHYKNFEDMVLAINKEYNRLVTTLKK